jgi:autotransporter-associated beta strand protein
VVVPAGTAAPLKGGFRFATLATPLNLAPGTYTIWGDNYGVDPDFNSGGSPAPGPTYSGPTGEVTYIQPNRYGVASTFPATADGGPVFRYGAASMIFTTVANPIPASTGLNLAAAGATFDLNGISAAVASLTGVAGSNLTLGSGTLTAGNAANTTFAGNIAGAGGIAKQGTGTLTLTGNNTYAGTTTILNGILTAGSATALGTAAGGTEVSSGSSLALTGGINIPGENIVTSGNGYSGLGAIRNLAGSNSLGGVISMQPTAASAVPAAVTMQNATASFSQAGLSVAAMIDGNVALNTGGWGNDPNPVGSTAVFETTADLNTTGVPTELTFSILNGSFTNHVVGKFKLYVTNDDRANFANGVISGGQIGTNWVELTPKSVISAGGQTMTINADNSILAAGTLPNSDTYTVKAHTSLANITGVRIDTLEDPSLPVNGPGRPANGNYVIIEWNIGAAALDSADTTIGSDAGTLTLNGNVANGIASGNLALLGAGDIVFDATSGVTQTSGATNVFKSGTGTVTNSGANNNFGGKLTVAAGTYVVGNSSALGTVAGGTQVNNGATLALTGGVTVGAESIDAAGAGVGGLGVIRNLAGSNTLGGPIALQGSSGSTAPVNATLQNATASFSQAGFSPAFMIDGNLATNTTGWANAPNPVGSTAVFETAANLNPTGAPTELTFSIFSGSFGTHTVGKFKLYVTIDNRANFADGVINGGQIGSTWVPLIPTSVTSTGGVTMTVNPDGSIIASGANPDSATYTVKAITSLANITGVRIETLEDPSFPVNGPGRPFNGNYVIIEWSVASMPLDATDATIGSDGGQLTLNGNVSAALSGTLSLIGAGAINLGATGGLVQTAGATQVMKTGTGTVTNAGANNTFAGKLTVAAGTYVAASNSALGSAVEPTQVNNGATLGLSGGASIAGETINLFGTGAAGMLGSLSNISGSNTLTATSSLVAADTTQQLGIGSLAGTLTVAAPINLKFARLTSDGPGDVILNGDIFSTLPAPTLATLNSYPTGNYVITAAGQTFTAYVNNDGTNSWLLLGRGREGWEFDLDGQGTPATVSTNLGVAAGFAPAAYSNAIVNDLLAQSGINNTNAEFRIRRATDPAGTQVYQEGRWRSFSNPSFTFDFDDANAGAGLPVTATISPSILTGSGGPTATSTRDSLGPFGNDAGRIFTWPWGSHNNQRGFSYGSGVNNGNNAAGSFLWEFAGENHAIPYAEFYVRSMGAQIPRDNSVVKNGTGTLTLGGTNTYTGTTTVNAGTLRVQNGNAVLDTAGAVSAALGATFQLLSNETVSSFVGAGEIGAGTNDSTLALGNNVLTSTSGASLANVTTGASGGIVVATTFVDADDDNNVTGTGIFLQAATGVGTLADPIETTVANLEAQSVTGGVFVANTGALAIGNVTGTFAGVRATTSGDINLSSTGNLSIVTTGEVVSASSGIVTLAANGAASDLVVASADGPNVGASGAISLAAGRDVLLGISPATYGDTYSNTSILITAGRDITLQGATYIDVNSAGTNTFVAGRDITLPPPSPSGYSRVTTRGGVISLTAGRNFLSNSHDPFGDNDSVDSTQQGVAPAGANVSITATTGNISLGDGVNAGTAGNISLSAIAGSITDTNIDGATRMIASGLTAASATGVLLETSVATVTAATASGAGDIDLHEVDAVNLVTVTAANGSIAVNAGGALTDAATGVISASGNGNLTAPSITLGEQAGDAVNFGTLTFTSTGAVTIEENSGLNLAGANSAAGAISLRSVDVVAAGQDIVLPGGATLSSTGSSVSLNAGDDATLTGNVSASTTVTVNVDSGNAATETAGGSVTVAGTITAPGGAFFNGDTDNDTFTVKPQSTAALSINGNAPIVAPGDVLNLDLTGTVSPSLSPSGTGAGTWSFGAPLQAVTYLSIEDVNAIGVGAYTLIVNASLIPYGNTGVDDAITLRMSGPDLIVERTGVLNLPNDPIAPIFQGDAANILSVTYLGSADNDIVTVSDVGGLMNFSSTVAGAPNNPNLAGQAEFLFNGNGGTDALVFNLTGATASQDYAIGDGSGGAGLEGELATISGGVTLMTYFQNVESTQRTGSGATPGALTVIGDSSANVFTESASGANTVISTTGYTPFQFDGNNYSGVVVNGGLGADAIDLVGIGAGQSNPLANIFNGEADADTLRVEGTGTNTGMVTLNGNAGNDLFQLYSAANTVNSIVGPVVVDGTDGNVGGNTDTLTIIDSGDVGGNNVLISPVNAGTSADYAVEGITTTLGNDVVFRNIDVLNYTGTQGTDVIDGQFLNTVPLHDLSAVSLSGWTGADRFLLFLSDQIGGSGAGLTPSGTPSGLAAINLYGDAPGNPNAGDIGDTFGATPALLVGTGSGNVGLAVPDSVRSIRPSTSTLIAIDGGQPIGLASPQGDLSGDVLNVDVSALPNTTPVIVSTFSPGTVNSVGIQPLNWSQIEDMNLVDQAKLTNVQMGDLFARTTPAADLIQFTKNASAGNPNQVRLRITATIGNYGASNKTIVYGGGLNDMITQANLNIPAEFYGEGGDDVLSGALNNDWLVGGLGNDRINGSGGDNVIWGDNSPTSADPAPQTSAIGGDDTLSGLSGNDVFYGGGGNDSVSAGAGNDYASGGHGDDTLDGHFGDDRLYGGAGFDTLSGYAGNDLLSGGSEDDKLYGDTGNDVLLAGTGADSLDGGGGDDLLVSGSVANENSSFTSLPNTTTFNTATYVDALDFDSALLTLLAQWGAASNRGSLAAITHDGADDDLFGSTGDDDFCWETPDILDDLPALNPPDYNAAGMGSDERFGPT